MRKIAFLISLIIFCEFNFFAQAKLTQEEYAVYASVLKAIYKENREAYSNKSEFVFLNETKVDSELDLPSSRKYKHLVKDFNRKNSTPGIVEKRFPRGTYSETLYLVSRAEVEELTEKGRVEAEKIHAKAKVNSSGTYIESPTIGCRPFYQKYPESSGHYTISRVGFSGQFAMVQVKGDLCWNGFSLTYILKRINGKWRIVTLSGSKWS